MISLGNAVELEAEEWVEVTIVSDVTGVCENSALSSLNSSSFSLLVLVMVIHTYSCLELQFDHHNIFF